MQNFIIKETKTRGKGLFSTVVFEKNQVLFQFKGKALSFSDAVKSENSERLLQIGKDIYLNVNDDYTVFTNHDCNPNTYIKVSVNNAFLVSSRYIEIGEEIVFDYSLTSTENTDTFSMNCNCSPFACRKIISGFHLLPDDKKKKMIMLGYVPNYVLENR